MRGIDTGDGVGGSRSWVKRGVWFALCTQAALLAGPKAQPIKTNKERGMKRCLAKAISQKGPVKSSEGKVG